MTTALYFPRILGAKSPSLQSAPAGARHFARRHFSHVIPAELLGRES